MTGSCTRCGAPREDYGEPGYDENETRCRPCEADVKALIAAETKRRAGYVWTARENGPAEGWAL